MNRTGTAHWEGGFKGGKGVLSTQSGALDNVTYSGRSRFETEPGTNPEELVAAAHAGCFTMMIAVLLEEKGLAARTLDTKANVKLEKLEDGYAITAVHLDVTGSGEGINAEIFEEVVGNAKEVCPISRLLRGSAKTTSEAHWK